MIGLMVLYGGRRKLSMKGQPHLPVQCECPPFPPLSLSSPLLLPPFLPFPLPSPPSVFPMDCLPIDSYCIFTSLFIISPPISPYSPLYITLSLTHFHSCILHIGRESYATPLPQLYIHDCY